MLNYGKFFRLNNEKSDLSKGITVFDYIWLRDNENSAGSSKFPVYVTLCKDSIDFHAHYYEDYTEGNRYIHKHLHNTILSLPLSANINVKDGLTGALVEGFKTNFPKYDTDGSNYLWNLHWKTFWKIAQEQETDITYCKLNAFVVRKGKEKEDTWGELINDIKIIKDDFRLRNETDFIEWCSGNCERQKSYKTIKRFIRKLILDFMFDLEQTKVFQTSPHYEHISVKLKENYFFSALAAKANFYYWREIIAGNLLNKKQELKKKKNTYYFNWNISFEGKYHRLQNEIAQLKGEIQQLENREIQSIETEYYLKTKMQWEKAIRNPKAEENFNSYEDEWFDDPEIEMKNVYRLNNVETTDKTFKETKKRNENFSKRWRIAHYDMFIKSTYWWMPRILISTAAAWFTFILGSGLWGNTLDGGFQKINENIGFCIGFWILLLLGSCIWIWYLGTKHKLTKFKQKWKIRQFIKGTLYITSWGLIYSFLIGFILMIFFVSHRGENKVHNLFCGKSIADALPTLISVVFIAMFVGLVIQSFMDKRSPVEEL